MDRVSKAVGMEFGLKKCLLEKLEKGKAVRTSVLPFPEGRQIERLNAGAVCKNRSFDPTSNRLRVG